MRGKGIKGRDETIYESNISGAVGIALAKIRQSEPHYHLQTSEWYLVVGGSATLYLNGKEKRLKSYDVVKIEPKTIHWVKGNLKVWVISYPPWKKEDYYKVVK